MQTIKVRHNLEVAHRLSLLKGKCEQIHGHSMWTVVEFEGHVDRNGVLLGMDFGTVKKVLRHHLDTTYDHHLLLNVKDPWAKVTRVSGGPDPIYEELPGLQVCPGDPTTENIARWIGEWSLREFDTSGLVRVKCEVWETSVNSATWEISQ